jgi:signal transduction histidine kinase
MGMSELLMEMQVGDEEREYITIIKRSAGTLLRVLNDVLDFTNIESGNLDIETVPFSLPTLVQDLGDIFTMAASQKQLDFQCDSTDIGDNLIVAGDPGRVQQVITSVLANSVKFTSQGSIRFTVSREEETAETIQVKFVVHDTGAGITEEAQTRLFQPFSQGDQSMTRKFGGIGLGLSITRYLLERMRGRIHIDSQAGAGTVVTFSIPFNKIINQAATEETARLIQDMTETPLTTPDSPPSIHQELRSEAATISQLPGTTRGHVLLVEDKLVHIFPRCCL